QLSLWGLATLVAGLAVLRVEPAPLPPAIEVQRVDLTKQRPVGLWSTQVTRSAFLDRTVWNLTFSGSVDPEKVVLDLVSDQPLTIFDCSFPVIVEPEGLKARIVVGRQPPLPLVLRITLPKAISTRLEVQATVQTEKTLELTDSVELVP